jgi:hypothetical protein
MTQDLDHAGSLPLGRVWVGSQRPRCSWVWVWVGSRLWQLGHLLGHHSGSWVTWLGPLREPADDYWIFAVRPQDSHRILVVQPC